MKIIIMFVMILVMFVNFVMLVFVDNDCCDRGCDYDW